MVGYVVSALKDVRNLKHFQTGFFENTYRFFQKPYCAISSWKVTPTGEATRKARYFRVQTAFALNLTKNYKFDRELQSSAHSDDKIVWLSGARQ